MTDLYLADLLSDLDVHAKASKWMPLNFRCRCKAVARAVRSGNLVVAFYWLNSLWCSDTKPILGDLMEAVKCRLSPEQHQLYTALQRERDLPLKPGKVENLILEIKIRKLQTQST